MVTIPCDNDKPHNRPRSMHWSHWAPTVYQEEDAERTDQNKTKMVQVIDHQLEATTNTNNDVTKTVATNNQQNNNNNNNEWISSFFWMEKGLLHLLPNLLLMGIRLFFSITNVVKSAKQREIKIALGKILCLSRLLVFYLKL